MSKAKLDRLVIFVKWILNLPNVLIAITQGSLITSQRLLMKHMRMQVPRDFWRIGNGVLNKGRFVILPRLNGLEVLSS